METNDDIAAGALPVLALTIIDGETLEGGRFEETTRVLVVVRDPDANVTHPDVVSMPTQRIPVQLAAALLANTAEIGRDKADETETVFLRAPEYSSTSLMNHNPVIYTIAALLSRKLGVGEQLEADRAKSPAMHFTGTVASTTLGYAKYPNMPHGQQREKLRMINVTITVTKGQGLFPAHTASYSYIRWVQIGRFLDAMRERNPMLLDSALRVEQYCIHGLCVRGAYCGLVRALGTK